MSIRFTNTQVWSFIGLALLTLGSALSLNAQEFPAGTPSTNQPVELPEPLSEDAFVDHIRLAGYESEAADATANQITAETENSENNLIEILARETQELTSREGTGSSIKLVLLLGALSLAPAILLMTTCYVRIIVVLTLLRQAFGGQQLPPNQVLTALSLFLTLLVMTPVWNEVKTEAIDPFANSESISWQEAWERGITPVKRFMGRQIEIADNASSIEVFYKYNDSLSQSYPPTSIQDVPITVLLPAFIVSELKVAFLLGFQIFLPFLVLDFVVSTVTVSMGMLMLPPTMVSFPLKLILFVMVDGWSLVVGMLLQSFGPTVV